MIDVICAEKKYKRYAKGLLMPMLSFVYVYTCNYQNIQIEYLIVLALLFGWMGDVALLNKTKRNIKMGILTFMLGHICYILTFLKGFTVFHASMLIGLIPYVIYAFIFLRKLLPHVKKDMIIPSIIYIMIILIMSISAYFRFTGDLHISYCLTLLGSICFLFSDSILAFQIYAKGSHHGVMILYLLAQTLIVISYLL